MPGSLNDINVFAGSCTAPVNYIINGHEYIMGYYLADGIYPNWSTFVKTILRPLGAKRKYFASKQECVRKDGERVFGVLQSRFAIVRGLVRYWCRTCAASRRSSTLKCNGYISSKCGETRNYLSLSGEKWCGSRHLVFLVTRNPN